MGAKYFMLLACTETRERKEKNILIVEEFMDVFPKVVSGLPSKRSIIKYGFDPHSGFGIYCSI